MKIIQSIKNNWRHLLLIIIFAVSIRFLYTQYNPLITIASDTYGYYRVGNRILQENFAKYIINDERTPIYPLFLSTIMKLQGILGISILSDEFFIGARLIVLVQHTIGMLSLILIFFILKSLKVKRTYAFLFTLIMAINPFVFSWERVLIPETISIFFLLFTVFIFIKGLEKGKTICFFLFLPSFIFGFLLKPIYILLPLFLLPLIPIYYRSRNSLLYAIFILFLYLLLPYLYIKQNESNFGYRGINHSSDINILGKILKYELPVESAKDVKYYYENIKDYRTKKEDPMPYRFLEYYDGQIYDKKELLNLLPSFNLKVIKANYKEFITKSFQEFPQALLDTSEIIASTDINTYLGVFFFLLYEIFTKFQYLYFLAIIIFPFSVFRFLKKPTFENSTSLLLGTISVYQIFFPFFSLMGNSAASFLPPNRSFIFLWFTS